MPPADVVTGAFGYTGKYIARRLLAMGRQVVTLTGHPERPNPFGERVRVAPFNFHRPQELADTMRGASTLYNTYWVRFARRGVTFEQALENTKTLILAARDAGIRRIVHISITNATPHSPLPYFRGKAVVEQFLRGSDLSRAIIRPTVIFGEEDILINNIAWLLRHFPFFVVPGSGQYRLQPVFVEDVAEIAVAAGQRETNETIDAVGPEVFTFDELVRLIAEKTGSRARIIHLPPRVALFGSRTVGWVLRDVLLTRDELGGLMANLLVSDPGRPGPTGPTRLSDWLSENAERIGRGYSSELQRHFR